MAENSCPAVQRPGTVLEPYRRVKPVSPAFGSSRLQDASAGTEVLPYPSVTPAPEALTCPTHLVRA
jgi:hypothetical protein